MLAGQQVDLLLLDLQVFAVEARYEAGPFPLPAIPVATAAGLASTPP